MASKGGPALGTRAGVLTSRCPRRRRAVWLRTVYKILGGATASRCAVVGTLRHNYPGARPCRARVGSGRLTCWLGGFTVAVPNRRVAGSGMADLARCRLRRFRCGDLLAGSPSAEPPPLQAHQARAGRSPDGAVAARLGGTLGRAARPGPPQRHKIAVHQLVVHHRLDRGGRNRRLHRHRRGPSTTRGCWHQAVT